MEKEDESVGKQRWIKRNKKKGKTSWLDFIYNHFLAYYLELTKKWIRTPILGGGFTQ